MVYIVTMNLVPYNHFSFNVSILFSVTNETKSVDAFKRLCGFCVIGFLVSMPNVKDLVCIGASNAYVLQ
jgi:hypothetical protein